MSLAQLLSLGRKEEAPRKELEEQKQEVPQVPKAAPGPKLNEEELKLLSEQAGRQEKALAKQKEDEAKEEEMQAAAAKRQLEEAADQIALVAKKRKEEAALAEANAKAMHKTTLCKFFFQSKCEKGQFCPFAHSLEEVQNANSSNTGQSGLAFKKKMCRFFEVGQCINGEFCSYAHSVEEINAATWASAGGSDWAGDWGAWDTGASGSGYGYGNQASHGKGADAYYGNQATSWSGTGYGYGSPSGRDAGSADWSQYGAEKRSNADAWNSGKGSGKDDGAEYGWSRNGSNSTTSTWDQW